MVHHPERARDAVGQGGDHLADLCGHYVSSTQTMACMGIVATLYEERALIVTIGGEILLKGRDEKAFSCVQAFPCKHTWPCFEHMDHDARLEVAF